MYTSMGLTLHVPVHLGSVDQCTLTVHPQLWCKPNACGTTGKAEVFLIITVCGALNLIQHWDR